jgi:hypothetical protein
MAYQMQAYLLSPAAFLAEIRQSESMVSRSIPTPPPRPPVAVSVNIPLSVKKYFRKPCLSHASPVFAVLGAIQTKTDVIQPGTKPTDLLDSTRDGVVPKKKKSIKASVARFAAKASFKLRRLFHWLSPGTYLITII